MRSRLVALVFVSLLAATSEPIGASKPALVPTMQDLAITWWGLSEGRTFMLLELDSAGVGTLVLNSGYSDRSVGYRIRVTRLVKYDIQFELEAVGGESNDVFLSGDATKGRLDLKIREASRKWRDEIVMSPWSELTTALDALKRCRDRIQRPPTSDTSARCD